MRSMKASAAEPALKAKNGEALSKHVPAGVRPKSLFGVMKGRITIKGDIVSPLVVEWEASVDRR